MGCPEGTPDWSNVTLATFNRTLLRNPELCTSCTCPLEIDGHFLASMSYYPSLAGNAVFTAFFGLLLLPQVYLGIRHKTWGFLIAMTAGLILEVLGYIARILMRDNMFTSTYFIMYLVCLTLAPAFLAAAIYLTLSRLVVIYAPGRARFRPQVYTYVFIGCDLVALVLQATGGGIASVADPGTAALQAGINTMVAGVAWQVFALALFFLLSAEFWMRVRRLRRPGSSSASSNSSSPISPDRGEQQQQQQQQQQEQSPFNPEFADLRARRSFEPWFIAAVFLAAALIFVRSVFRCAELSDGFNGELANDEVTFMVLEGTMIALACILLTFFHPGLIVGSAAWAAASWRSSASGTRGVSGDAEKATLPVSSDGE